MAGQRQTTAQIAVIVPVYNAGDYLRQCVDSILAQTYRDYELILVDDGSTDGSGAVCDDYAAADDRIHVIHKENGGLMSAWMAGVQHSTAPYLFFVDADDWVDGDALERLMSAATTFDSANAAANVVTTEHPREIICAGCVIEREWNHTSIPEDNAITPGVYEGERLRTEIRENLLGNEVRRILPSRCMKLIDRRLIEDNLHYCDPSIKMGEDLNIMAPALLDADRVVVLDKALLYHYRYVSASMVHRYDAGLYDNVQRLIAIMRQVFADKHIANGAEQVDHEFTYLFLLTLKNEIRRRGVGTAAVVSRIRTLCKDAQAQDRIARLGGRAAMTSGANRLLASIMEHPTGMRIRMVRLIFQCKG